MPQMKADEGFMDIHMNKAVGLIVMVPVMAFSHAGLACSCLHSKSPLDVVATDKPIVKGIVKSRKQLCPEKDAEQQKLLCHDISYDREVSYPINKNLNGLIKLETDLRQCGTWMTVGGEYLTMLGREEDGIYHISSCDYVFTNASHLGWKYIWEK